MSQHKTFLIVHVQTNVGHNPMLISNSSPKTREALQRVIVIEDVEE